MVSPIQKSSQKTVQNKSSSIEPMTKMLLIIVFVVAPCLSYLILKPSPKTQANSVQQAREFATYIDANPSFVRQAFPENHEPKTVVQASSNKSNGRVLELTLNERTNIYDFVVDWNKADLSRDQRWRDQVDSLFSIAERSQNPDTLDLLRREILECFDSDDLQNKNVAKSWLDRYLKIESREEERAKVEAAYQEALNRPADRVRPPSN